MKKLKFNLSVNQMEYMVYCIIINSLNPEFIEKICQENDMTEGELINALEESLEICK